MLLLIFLVTVIAMADSQNCFTKCRERFFNVSKEIFDIINKDDYREIVIDNNMTESFNNNTERVLKRMTLSCRYYTEVNSYKYQLQEVLLHKEGLSDELFEKITLLLIKLQVAARSLQHIKMTASNEMCIEFSSEEYKHIYAVRNTEMHRDILYELRTSSYRWQYKLEPCTLI